MTDPGQNETHLESTWRSIGSAWAAGAGALTALISLFANVPLATACGRGALALFGVLLVVRLGSSALAQTSREPISDLVDEVTGEPLEQERSTA